MKKWLLVTTTDPMWTKIYHEDDIEFPANKICKRGDLVLVYQQSPHNKFSFIFQVKKSKHLQKGLYKTTLHKKVEIKEPVSLSDTKNAGINLTGRTKFHADLYHLTEKEFSEFIKLILKKNKDLFSVKKQNPCLGADSEGYSISLKKELIRFINDSKKLESKILNEEETKYLLILPILRRLGWNTWNLKQVFPEHHADGKEVDYALEDYEDNRIFIEAKRLSEDINVFQYKKQLVNYCIRQGITNGALTNGKNWILYDFHYWNYGKGLVKKVDHIEVDLFENPKKGASELIKFFWKKNTKKKKSIHTRPEFREILHRIKKINHNQYQCYNEAAVKQSLILPLICSLGWNIKDNNDFIFNPLIKYRKKRFKPDYLLNVKKKPAVALEIKKMGSDLYNENYGYVKDFTIKGDANVGVLTDGKKWIFILSRSRTFCGLYEYDLDSNNVNDTSILFKKLLSKESIDKNENFKHLEHLI